MAVPRTVPSLRCPAYLSQYSSCNQFLIPRFAKDALSKCDKRTCVGLQLFLIRVLCAFLGSAFCQCGRPPDRLRLPSLPFHLQCNPRERNCTLWQPSICTVISFRQRPAADVDRLALRSRLAERPVSPSRILRSSPALARWEFLR